MKNSRYPQIQLYHTYKREKVPFVPHEKGVVKMYVCGPTVYEKTHIGHAHMYIVVDFLTRFLHYTGYDVIQARNYTDVGHLVSDGDEGVDKMEKGAQKTGLSVWELADQMIGVAESFFDKIGILEPNFKPRASETVDIQIEMIEKLIEKGYAYVTNEAIYFDVRKFKDYEHYTGQLFKNMRIAVRDEVETGSEKKFFADFALWFFTVGRFKDHVMRWESPWGTGFPGWHIECSAMSYKFLGYPVDIHTGGEEHIKSHHANEIAQSEAATGEQFVKYWFHNRPLLIDGKKMSKSLGNFFTIEDLENKGFDAMDLRYLYATSLYRQRSNFSWEAMKGARNGRLKLTSKLRQFSENLDVRKGSVNKEYKDRFIKAVADDLNMPKGLAVLWDLVSSKISPSDKYKTILDFDEVFGFKLKKSLAGTKDNNVGQDEINQIEELIALREQARKTKDWTRADEIRNQLLREFRVELEDLKSGTEWKKVN